jgi:hypothetical protein
VRISSNPRDRGYAPLASRNARVWLAGVERKDVITADEEQRFALCVVFDEHGRAVVDEKTGKPKTVDFYGDVRVELPPSSCFAGLLDLDCID